MIRLLTLGALDLRNAEGSELRAVLAQPRRLGVLGFLALATPHGFHRRDRLLALFWPDHDSERARRSLNRAVYFIRRQLGDDILLSRGDEELGLNRARFWCDAGAFVEALDSRQHREALALYRGDLMPGFFVSGAPGFEQWLELERARLRERASDAAWRLADEEEMVGNLTPAVHWARRGLELSPFREIGLRRLLAMLDRAGDRAAAASAYERFAGELTAELDLDPSPETRALIDSIRSRASQREGPSASQPNDLSRSPDVAGPAPTDTSPARVGSSPLRRKALAWALPALALFGVARALLVSDVARDPMRIDVAMLENRTGDPALENVARAVTDRIIGRLGQTGIFGSIAPRHSEASSFREAWSGLVGQGSSQKRERGGVGVSGAITREGGTFMIRVQLTDMNHGGRVWTVAPIPIVPAAPEQGTNEVGARVVGGVAALRDPYFAGLLPVANPPPTFEAFQEFMEGFQLEARGQPAQARRHYRLAVAIDSTFTWPLVRVAWSALFDFRDSRIEEADSVLRVLSQKHDQISPLQQHLTEYMLRARAQDWAGAYRAIRDAADLAPLHFSITLALRASNLSRPREAIEALLRPGMDSFHRRDTETYWLMLSLSYHQLGEFGNELEAARRARMYRPDSRSALIQEIRALAAIGNIDAIRARIDTLVAMPKEGPWSHPAWDMIRAAEELREHGYPQAARELGMRAVAWHRSRPAEERAMPMRRWSLAYCLYFLEQWEEAGGLLKPLVAEFPNHEEFVGLLGTIAARQGDHVTAAKHAAKLASLERVMALPGEASIINRAKIAALLGDRALAVSLLKDAYGAQGTLELHTDFDFEGLRDYPPFQELTRPKG